MTDLQPQGPIDPQTAETFRNSMRRLAGGVALITSQDGHRRFGMTMTALMSLSMEPPSLVVAINRSASIQKPLAAGHAFCVNLLKHVDEGMCRVFSSLPSEDRFSVGEWGVGPHGTPFLKNAQAAIFCDVGPIHDYGTHSLVIGEVSHAWVDDTVSPLVHLDGRYLSAMPVL